MKNSSSPSLLDTGPGIPLHYKEINSIPIHKVMGRNYTDPFGLRGGNNKLIKGPKASKKYFKKYNIKNLTTKERENILEQLNLTNHVPFVHRDQPIKEKKLITCLCNHCESSPNCTSREGCFSTLLYETRTGIVKQHHYGCLHENQTPDSMGNEFLCAGHKKQNGVYTSGSRDSSNMVTTRCCKTNFCNTNAPPKVTKYIMKSTPINEHGSYFTTSMAINIGAPIAAFCFLLAVVFAVFKILQRKGKNVSRRRESEFLIPGTTLAAEPLGEDSLRRLIDVSVSSGSGSGLPKLVQRTVAQQILLCEIIGKGRYGEVWRGTWKGENVAVKIFASRDEQSWRRETDIFNTFLLRHDNILGYIASDIATRNDATCMWLITRYHVNGSLYDYLNIHSLDPHQMCLIALSTISGLAHLHSEISGALGKPAIAHRDVKTKNILVKKDGQCCISDLGLAVLHDSEAKKIDIVSNTERVGTKRYMSPEILEQNLNSSNFEAYKQADMYAMGLVFWEIARRTICNDTNFEYQPPYFDKLHQDPSFDDVKKVVCEDKYRPQMPRQWFNDESLIVIARIMQECWSDKPSSRLTALRVKKTLAKLMQKLDTEKRLQVRQFEFGVLTPSIPINFPKELQPVVYLPDKSTSSGISSASSASIPLKSETDV